MVMPSELLVDTLDLARGASTSVPLLSMTWVAMARLSSRDDCEAMRASASSRVQPRSSTIRRTASSMDTSTTITASNRSAMPISAINGMSLTTRAPVACRLVLARAANLVDERMRDRLQPPPGRFVAEHQGGHPGAVELDRRAVSISGPNSSTIWASPGVPSATTSRAIWSESITTAPSSRRIAETVLFPEATPPVRPTFTRALSCPELSVVADSIAV